MSTSRKEAMRQTMQADTLRSLGFNSGEAEALRRISMTLRRWYESECNGERERDETTGRTYWAHEGRRLGPCVDREKNAEKRLDAIISPCALRS